MTMPVSTSFVFHYLYLIEVLMLIAAVIIAISSLDDLFVDIFYWTSRIFGKGKSRSDPLPPVHRTSHS